MFRRRSSALAVLAAALVVLTACGSSSSGESDSSEAGYPVTIEHALGTTEVESAPERVAAVGGWPNAEVALALDIVPVGMPRADYGDDDGDGIHPWTEERLTELDAEAPVLFDETEGIDFEAVAQTEPDVILAAYSGLTQEEYDTLSKIAPVVAYPELPWVTSWREIIELNSTALGLADEGRDLVTDLEEQISEATARYPQLAETSAAFISVMPSDLSVVGVAAEGDARASYLADLGLQTPTVVTENSADAEGFRFSISAEEIDALDDTDIVLGYSGEGTRLRDVLREDPLVSRMAAAQRGSVAEIQDGTPVAAAVNPSALAIPWALDELLALLADAADRVD